MNTEPQNTELPVLGVTYTSAPCKERGGLACLKVSYQNEDEKVFDAFYFPEATMTWLRKKFEVWWETLSGSEPAPMTVLTAIHRSSELRVPTHITVKTEAKFPEIVSFHWRL